MYCEKYRCSLSELACAVRWRNAASQAIKDVSKPGYSDCVCQGCAVGKENAQKQDPVAVKAYSAKLSTARHNARDFYSLNQQRKRAKLDPLPILPPGVVQEKPVETVQPIVVSVSKKKRGRPRRNHPEQQAPKKKPGRVGRPKSAPADVMVFLLHEMAYHKQHYDMIRKTIKRMGGEA